MILNGNQRGSGQELACHLMNVADNDHIAVHDLRGFLAENLAEAFAEAEAISAGTKCEKYLFSLGLNPPQSASVSIEDFQRAIEDIERRLGLNGQPRAIVFHEKEGRRHAHCVWSRINVTEMKAINLPHYKLRLTDISRELYRTYQWNMPAGLIDGEKRNPNNYTHAEASQAKRAKRDPAKLKALFQNCWSQSDSREGFAAALNEHGFALARGDRRGFVAVDADGEVYSLSRWCGVRAKALRERFGMPTNLPTVEAAKAALNGTDQASSADQTKLLEQAKAYQTGLAALVQRQRKERTELEQQQDARRVRETKERFAKLPKGLSALWARISGQHEKLVARLALAAETGSERDRREIEALIERHLHERRLFEEQQHQLTLSETIHQVFADVVRPHSDRLKLYSPDPNEPLIRSPDDAPFTPDQIRSKPERIVDVLSDKKSSFTRSDIVRALSDIIDDPIDLRIASDTALQSSELVRLPTDDKPLFTTKNYRKADKRLNQTIQQMAQSSGFAVKQAITNAAIKAQNKRLTKQVGATLSDEQVKAIQHVLQPNQLSAVVGLAGAGKSTLLSVARRAWEKAGYTVHGAALAGKAADSLQTASGIKSRTLASLEASWKSGYEPVGHGDIVVIDEAGMVGTRQLERVANHLKQRGCKLVLVGDPEQLQPIQAGTPFKQITEDIETARLTEVRRQKNEWQRRVSRDLAEGRIEAAMQAYGDAGHIKSENDRDHAIAKLIEDYVADIEANGHEKSRLALAHQRVDVHAINQGIKAALRDKNGPQTETLIKTTYGPRAFTEGDRILFTRNDATLQVRNGMLGTIQNVGGSEITVKLDNEVNQASSLTFSPKHFPHFDHGYAVSIHRAQGCTVDQSFVLSSKTLDKHLTYVAMTRHRDGMLFYAAPEIERDQLLALKRRRYAQFSSPNTIRSRTI
ncbi:MAG: AAA family ATPase [Pseudomonadota bacterium]